MIFGLLLLISQSNHTFTFYDEDDDIDLTKVATYTCGIGLLAVGAAAIYNYFHTSNQQLIDDTNILLDKTYKYQEAITILNEHKISNEYLVSEVVLGALSQKINSAVMLNRYVDSLRKLKQKLASNLDKISKRKSKLDRKLARLDACTVSYAVEKSVLNAMSNLELTARPMIRDLSLLHRCLYKHASYITLFQIVSTIHKRYSSELAVLKSGDFNNLKYLARSAMAPEYLVYPLTQYARYLKNDSAELLQNLSCLNHSYHVIINQAYDLQEKLDNLYRAIVSDSAYVTEQYARRESDLREERLCLEWERLQLERERLFALTIMPRPQISTTTVFVY